MATKRTFIKDPLWGNVELFSWETHLTNHFIVNRLTNIIQNSSAFRAYPGLKYSRFLHTLGVVHVATELCANAVKNAESSLLIEFRKEAKKAESFFTKHQATLIREELGGRLDQHGDFAVLLATLRMASFIHDLGHLPYSHVFENALESFVSPGLEKAVAIEADAKTLRIALQLLLKEKPGEKKWAGEANKVHERLGLQLASALEHDLESRKGDQRFQLSALLIHVARELLSGSDFPIAVTFIKGTIDADRIDFARRDGHFSGLFSSSIDYGRLFALYTLGEANTDGTKHVFSRPSPRAISETEKVLLERFQSYKYVVMHHKVHLYDEVVENIIIHLMASGKLNRLLEDLIQILGLNPESWGTDIPERTNELLLLREVLLEFDDPWLESHIRGIYRKNVETRKRLGDKNKSRILFEAYVEDRRRFVSAFKSDCQFWEAVEEHAPRFQALRPSAQRDGDEVYNERTFFFRVLYAAKFSLQAHLCDKFNFCVILGPTDKKVNYGVKNDELAHFYQVTDLVDFLKRKKYDTMLFNLWYDRKSGILPEDFARAALPIIETTVFEAINKAMGVRELDFKST